MFETYLDLVSNLTGSHNCQSFDRWVWSSAAKRATLIAITHHEQRHPHQINNNMINNKYDDEEKTEREHLIDCLCFRFARALLVLPSQ